MKKTKMNTTTTMVQKELWSMRKVTSKAFKDQSPNSHLHWGASVTQDYQQHREDGNNKIQGY